MTDYSKLDVENKAKQLPDEALVIGDTVRNALKKIPTEKQRTMYLGVHSFFIKAVKYLMSRLPLNNRLLSSLTYLQPQQSVSSASVAAIHCIARKLPNISDADVANLTDEWNLYQVDQKTAEMINDMQTNPLIRIDHYWRTVTAQKGPTGELKYPVLAKLIKAALIIPHGNADVERGFSISNNVLTEERTAMSVETLNGLLSTKDALAFYDPERQLPSSLPITKAYYSHVAVPMQHIRLVSIMRKKRYNKSKQIRLRSKRKYKNGSS